MTHTKGPWRVAAPPDKVCTSYGDQSDYASNGSAKTIATCEHRSWMSDGEEFSNAKLIAAAPDLFSALKEIVHNYDTGNYAAIDMPAARDALSRATA